MSKGRHAKPKSDVTRAVVGRFHKVISGAGLLGADPNVQIRVTRQGDGRVRPAPSSGGKHRGS